MFLVLSIELACSGDHLINDTAAELAIFVGVLLVFAHVEIDATVGDIGVASVEDALHEGYLLHDVARGVRLDTGGQHVEALHGGMVAVGVVLRHLHGLELLEAGLLGNLVLTLIGIVLQVSHVGDIAHIAHLVAEVAKVAIDHIKGDGGTRVTQMAVAVNGGATDIHAHTALGNRLEEFLLPT